jgi:hypothetical protein
VGCCSTRTQVRHAAPVVFPLDFDGCEHVYRVHHGHTQLKIVQGTMNAVKYRDDSLDPIVLYFLQQPNVDHVFQHDNTRCHVARVCQDFLNQNHIRVLP